ncbi:7TM diverse intracellular signaling domain-containing protein [Leptospira sp. SA-E8]|uniref:7TM diverse intracellular signaling domain-containing protein n=1 Tax=Leptospira sp. SA-E8 TaxID=3422259 RepID=UPI003EBDFD42
MKIFRISLLCILSFFLFITSTLHASDCVSLDPRTILWEGQKSGSFSLGEVSDYLIESTATLKAEEVLEQKDKFQASKKELGFGYTPAKIWVKTKIKNCNPSQEIVWFELVSLIDSIEFYKVEDGKAILVSHTGRTLPVSDRNIRHRNFIFPLALEPEKESEVLFGFQSKGSLLLPLKVWNQESFLEEEHKVQFLFGAYFGLLAVMLLYNLFLFFSVKDLSYLFYCGYIFLLAFVQSGIWGFTHLFIFPDLPAWADATFPITINSTGIFALLFAYHFLRIKERLPRIKYLYLFLGFVSLSLGILGEVGFYRISVGVGLVAVSAESLLIFGTSLYFLLLGYREARLFLAGWSMILIGAVIIGLRNFGILPFNFFTNYSVQIGSVLEAVLLSLSLGDKINILELQRKETERKALEDFKSLSAAFSRFFNSRIIPVLGHKDVRDVKAGDAVRVRMAVLFLDIRGFTTFSERKDAAEVFAILNLFLSRLVPSVEKEGGFVDKFIGDSIMALYPGSPADAVRSAISLIKATEEFNKENLGKISEIKVGIGIHYGNVILGTVGSETRLDGTAIGDTVNTASRLEGLTRKYEVPILVSSNLVQAAEEIPGIVWKSLGETEIKGRSATLEVFTIGAFQ